MTFNSYCGMILLNPETQSSLASTDTGKDVSGCHGNRLLPLISSVKKNNEV